ncbi:MAG: hypothetical protein NTX33_19955 [Propionibacteriales bacterium]|nr:hypothetical protein [Propionibacteriales bacterium]
MNPSHPGHRRTLPALVILALAMLASLGAIPSAAAHNFDGRLQVKGTGTNFAGSNADTALAATPGTAVSYALKAVNKGTADSQYRIVVEDIDGATTAVTAGSLIVTQMAGNPSDGYFTPPIKPGASFAFTVKVTVPVGSPQKTYRTYVSLYNAGAFSYSRTDFETLYTEVKAPAKGTATGLYVRSGSLPFVGGPAGYQRAGAPAIKVGQTSTFTVRLRNDSPVPAQMTAQVFSHPCASFSVTSVKQGAADYTFAWRNGGFVTPTIAKGAQLDFTVVVKYLAADPNCTLGLVGVYSYGYGDNVGSYQYLVVPASV